MYAETLYGRSAGARGQKVLAGESRVLRSSSVWPLQLSSNGFSDTRARVGPSEPDRQAPQAEAGGPSGAGPEANHKACPAITLASEASPRSGLSEILEHRPQDNDARRRQARPRRRERWKRLQGKADPRKPVFIDEIWMKTNMSPSYGSSPKGHRARGLAPSAIGTPRTFIAALRHDRVDALGSWTDRPKAPPPNLRRNPAGPDAQPRRHRHHGQQQPQNRSGARCAAGRGAGAHLLFLPPSSPDLKLTEQVLAKLKPFLWTDQPRTRDDLRKNIGSILKTFGPEECANDLANSGYAAVQN